MKRIITLVLCLTLILVSLASCSNKYEFAYAFFQVDVANDYVPAHDLEGSDITAKYELDLSELMSSLINFINTKFNLDINKPIPNVKSFTPSKESIVATYHKGTIFVNTNFISDYPEFFIIHELIHYLSDIDGNSGFTHLVKYNDYNVFVGYGITEGYADILSYMYCKENGIGTPDLANTNYNNNERVAAVYYLLEPDTMRWFLTSDHKSMSDFVKEEIKKIAIMPADSINNFDFHFYVCQDLLLDCSTGNINDYGAASLSFQASFEMACITARASKNVELKKAIYNDILSICDNSNALKNMILG